MRRNHLFFDPSATAHDRYSCREHRWEQICCDSMRIASHNDHG
ncbi:MAG: hypothetical protein Q9M26_04380 [Mariprofundales bacterium]|nr:hypothetical protein [Mariprofundales bacterium]